MLERPGRRMGLLAAVTLAAALVAGCDADDDDAAAPPSSSPGEAALPGDAGPVDTYLVAAGDSLSAIARTAGVSLDELVAVNGWSDGAGHVIHPGDAIALPDGASVPGRPSTTASPGGAPPTTAPQSGAGTGGYREVGHERLLPLADDGTSHPIGDPLADGVYYATSYDVANDGASVQFQLARFYDVEACVATMETVPSGTVDASGCYGGWVDTSTTAVVTMPVDPAVPVILVSFDYRYYEVTAEEFARLLSGEPPSPEAPAGYEFQPYWRAMVDVEAGTVVRANQQPSS